MSISDFLRAHAATLDQVNDGESRARWHQNFAAQWGPQAQSLATSANALYGLSGEALVQSDLGYLTAESSPTPETERTLILLSANPGWVRELNAVERTLKGQPIGDGVVDLDKYDLYRRNFFPRWYEDVVKPINWQRGMWWNNALNFLHCVAGLTPSRKMCRLDPRLHVIGWELWPMHSARDGLTAAAQRDSTLREFAKQSIRAALRTRAEAVVIASVAGFELLEELQLDGLTGGRRGEIEGIKVRAWTGAPDRPSVFAVRRQLFAGWGRPSRVVLDTLAEFCGGRASAPRSTAERAVPAPIRTARPPAPDCIALQPADDRGPLIWVRPVPGSESHGLDALAGGSSEEEVHRRIGGYWATPQHLGLAGARGRGGMIREALRAGRRVFVLGRVGDTIVRVVEVSEEPYLPPEREEFTGSVEARLATTQSSTLDWPSARSGRWGTEYDTEIPKSPRRVRLHTATVDDREWIGRTLEGAGIRVQNPGLFTTAHPLPTRLEP